MTLKLAELYSNVPFYLTVNSDWIVRLYTQSFFITYQGSDLSLAQLNFSDGQKLNKEGLYYLYIYVANNHN